jgi:hypothetical protein
LLTGSSQSSQGRRALPSEELSAQAETPTRQTADVSFDFGDQKSHRTITSTYLRYRGATFKAILDETGGAGMGFDLLRLVLAILILLTHCSWPWLVVTDHALLEITGNALNNPVTRLAWWLGSAGVRVELGRSA